MTDEQAPDTPISPMDPLPPPDELPTPPPRQDGPTLDEFLAAGYDAKDYPPAGYAPQPLVPFKPQTPGRNASGYSLTDDEQ